MSTKIYGGRILPGGAKNIAAWQERLRCARQRFQRSAEYGSYLSVFNHAVSLEDMARCGARERKENLSSLLEARSSYDERCQAIKKGVRDPLLDRSVQVSWCIDGDDIVAMLFVQNLDLEAEVEAFLGLKDFHYQNQVDKPEDISDEDWDLRRSRWERVLTLDGRMRAPRETMFVYDVADEPKLLIWLSGSLPELTCGPHRERAERVAFHMLTLEVSSSTGEEATYSSYRSILKRTEPGGDLRERLIQLTDECMSKIEPNPTLDYVKQKSPPLLGARGCE